MGSDGHDLRQFLGLGRLCQTHLTLEICFVAFDALSLNGNWLPFFDL